MERHLLLAGVIALTVGGPLGAARAMDMVGAQAADGGTATRRAATAERAGTEISPGGQVITAVVDRARLVRIPAGTSTLIIGNPTIADVTMLKPNNLMVLTPKAFGETNFIALDAAGNPVAESMINVVNSDDAVIVQRGMDRQSYSCSPRCQPTERLGDDEKYLSAVAGQDQAHGSRLAGSQAPTALGPR